ncbi:hypothetical protein QL093DRAFT_2081481 [Fusarium oxysporum]|nr:hypothetical protein QL093DRAFT_2081481 [Fusarium oxysporum]
MRNRSSTNDIILAIKHIEVKASRSQCGASEACKLYNNAGDNGDEGHAGNVAQSGATLNFGVHEGVLQTFDPRDQALLDPEKPYDQRWQEKHRAPGPGNDRSPTS